MDVVTAEVRERTGLRGLPRATALGRVSSRPGGDALEGLSGLVGVAVDGTAGRGGRTSERAPRLGLHRPARTSPHAVQAIGTQRRRTSRKTRRTTLKTICTVTSPASEKATATRPAEAIRGHWHVRALAR